MARVAAWLVLSALMLWALLALYLDGSQTPSPVPLFLVFIAVVAAALSFVKNRYWTAAICLTSFAVVLTWWLSLRPSNDRPWQADVARSAWAETEGDRVVIHDVRNFDYRTETDYLQRWETRAVHLSQIKAMDLFLTTWGVPGIAHPIISFEFTDGQHIAFSIETRKQVGSDYSTFRGFFRQYELIYVVSDERDVVRLRTNYRKGEEVRLYRLRATPEQCRRIFVEYIRHLNRLKVQPEWYNALTHNCTTSIRMDVGAANDGKLIPWDYRLLLNASMDKALYQMGDLDTTLPFEELRGRAYINQVARASDQAIDFSQRIRQN